MLLGMLLLDMQAGSAECSKVPLPACAQDVLNTWKAMTTTNAKAEDVPSFWKKSWNALVRWFQRDKACTCSAETQSTPKVEEPKVEEKKSAV